MKTAWNLIAAFIVINLLAAAGFVGWKYTQGYISMDRVQAAKDLFALTIEEEARQQKESEQLAEDNKKAEQQLARLESTAEGPITVRDRLEQDQNSEDVIDARVRLINDQNRALREEMARFKEDYNRRVAELDQERADFEQWVEDQAEQTKDANFQQVVTLYQTQPPKQTKQAFQTLMQQGETEQVVDYLAAMSSRKAGQVLAQFKTPAEVAQAAELLEKLRTRGEYTMDESAASTGNLQ